MRRKQPTIRQKSAEKRTSESPRANQREGSTNIATSLATKGRQLTLHCHQELLHLGPPRQVAPTESEEVRVDQEHHLRRTKDWPILLMIADQDLASLEPGTTPSVAN